MTVKNKKKTALSKGRPPHAHKQTPNMKSKTTRKLINTTHQLNKELARATSANDSDAMTNLQTQLTRLGGLKVYQQASIQGQSKERGGDSSSVLLDFLAPIQSTLLTAAAHPRNDRPPRPRLLEVGALSTSNACSKSGWFDVVRIDLHSQSPGIEQQDFMQRPIPQTFEEKFDVLSLSLVLNFVPTPVLRGEMLLRTTRFLRHQWESELEINDRGDGADVSVNALLPALFVVLPMPCLSNSRYLDEERFTQIMDCLGYTLLNVKRTDRMYYSLWQLGRATVRKNGKFPKEIVNPGGGRNNFCIVSH